MFRDEKLELKVGIFMGIGIFLMFLLVFSISDFYGFQKGYDIKTIFDFVNGLGDNAPVRLAGVNIGEVKKIEIFYDNEAGSTKVRIDIRIHNEKTKIETDAVARINTLGLLGEQYLEITPGKERQFIKNGDFVVAKNPVNVGMQMEKMQELVSSFTDVTKSISSGEGTLGKLIKDDTIHQDLVVILDRIKNGEGTVGKLLTEENIYNNLDAFVADIKAHPWKLLSKPRSDRKGESSAEDERRGTAVKTR